MKHLVIGHGEVGTAVAELLACDWTDVISRGTWRLTAQYDTLHICFPYSFEFAAHVEDYRRMFHPRHVVVHSTVPVGTCEALGAIHSPVRGVHPHMVAGLRTFVKYFGGPEALEVAVHWPGPCCILRDARTCEALKLWDTTQYGVHIRLMQEIHRWCAENGVEFEAVYRHANRTYNVGFEQLGRIDVMRPWLTYEGKDIGGHCVKQNAELLESPVAQVVREGFK